MTRVGIAVAALLALLLLISPWQDENPKSGESTLRLAELMGAKQDVEGYLTARPGPIFTFPKDHWQHQGYQNEWWYLTANLHDRNNPDIRFGVQLTVFRFALAADREEDANPWLSPNMYMAHFAITHVADNQHRASERFSRQGPNLAGAKAMPQGDQSLAMTRIWLADWQLQSLTADDLFPMLLQAADGDKQIAASLSLKAVKPMVLQGEQGFSRKNLEGGGSYYYSYPRLTIAGTLNWDKHEFEVSGEGWFDHEWSSNSLAPYQAGWDWFSLQLQDGSELMYYGFRNHDGSDGLKYLARISAEGEKISLDTEQLDVTAVDQWHSPDGTVYPSGWRLKLPTQGLDLYIEPRVSDQLMDLSVRYWEGAVKVSGSHQGSGYVELAGYK
ncbi:MAG: lipocalin-like domain-containing protein [Motiliproteus sp.]